ncbi:CAP domain-containing protein [Pyxidicoccus parkwayensis]|uniref:CAP domain-containing protein n=1 Tax=Pyxidicoccus parkwayensis TaxID=2813578 RepID=A0ABX7P5M1_9BACT|nr:CAP domain-containing protein [Pyxidicoccus parkwaysis]QSQ25742.1 CAP domain-containing protein [Pyxidicoccus parkwaysis]
MIALLALGAFLAATPPAPPSTGDMEAAATRHVVQEFERVGRRAPEQDANLSTAARRLALEALTEYTTGAPDHYTLTEAVSDAGGADPTPRTLLIRAWTPRNGLETFLARTDFNAERASHYGLGVAQQGQRTAFVLLLADRKAELQPFPRNLAGGERAASTLCGTLVAPLREADVYVTRPDGDVDRVSLSRKGSNGVFCARLQFPKPGGYTVEVVGTGNNGPEVAALFLVQLGMPRERGERTEDAEPTTPEEARAAVYERINSLRRAHHVPELTPEPVLERVAQAYSDRMAAEGFFAHVAPDGSTLTQRLPASLRSMRSGENLGVADGPLAAHFGIEHSPGHRRNLLDPAFRVMGLGVTFHKVDGRDEVILTEVYTAASPTSSRAPETPEDPRQDVYDTLARWRTAHKLPPLERSPALEALAQAHAKRALDLDQPSEDAGPPLHERVFQALPDAGTAAVDFFVLTDPSALPESRSLGDATNNRVGIGVVRGDSRRFGSRRYWVAVIYASVR